MATRSDSSPRLSIKFLVSNGLAGSLIGTAGAAIKELIDVTKAKVLVSGITDVYPGTSDRIILVSGSEESVDAAQKLVWSMMALNVRANGDKTVSWSPREASESSDDFEDVIVTGKISIPATAGGLILGRGGATIRSIHEESGAQIQMTSKDESMFTQERILTITGSPVSCAHCVSLVLVKLTEEIDSAQYVNRGVTYSSHVTPLFNPSGGSDPRGRGRGGRGGAGGETPPAEVATNTTISLTVPDNLVGNILGKQVSCCRIKEFPRTLICECVLFHATSNVPLSS